MHVRDRTVVGIGQVERKGGKGGERIGLEGRVVRVRGG